MRLEAVGKRYGLRQPWVVRGVSADVPAGRLIPSPGLLVLDEAWTGLDQAARAELDSAVGERVAVGGTVLFVDHEAARLAGREDERWNFDGAGGVAILADPAPVQPRGWSRSRSAWRRRTPHVSSARSGPSRGRGCALSTSQGATSQRRKLVTALLRYQTAILLAAAWGVSVLAATRRDTWSHSST